jgi:hypothetical protein
VQRLRHCMLSCGPAGSHRATFVVYFYRALGVSRSRPLLRSQQRPLSDHLPSLVMCKRSCRPCLRVKQNASRLCVYHTYLTEGQQNVSRQAQVPKIPAARVPRRARSCPRARAPAGPESFAVQSGRGASAAPPGGMRAAARQGQDRGLLSLDPAHSCPRAPAALPQTAQTCMCQVATRGHKERQRGHAAANART